MPDQNTDSFRPAAIAPPPRTVEQTDAEPAPPRLDLSTAKVGAAAAASVTTSLAASFFGTAGTLIGAAFGAVVSTVAGALYENSMHRAVDRVRATQAITIQRPDDAPTAGPTAGPTAVADLTQVLPAVTDATRALPESPMPPDPASTPDPASPPDPASLPPVPAGAQPWWRSRIAAVTAACALAFVIAIGTITVAEGLLHKTVSGQSGTTVGRVFGEDGSSTSSPTSTPTASPTTSATASAPATASPTRAAVAPTTAPRTATPTTAPTTTGTTSSTTADTSAAVDGTSPTAAP